MKNEKEQPERQEQPLVIAITPTRGLLILLALVLVTAACLGYLAWGQQAVAASAPAAPAASTGMRKYYLATGGADGNGALTACAPGYHMAALWEIMDPSKLEYNSDLGDARADSGVGPATYVGGWVRTGYTSSGLTGVAGADNCLAWTSDDSAFEGTFARLPHGWTLDYEDLHIWDVDTDGCNHARSVWCVED